MKTQLKSLLTKMSLKLQNTRNLVLLVCLFLTGLIHAQDKITLKDGTEIDGKVIEIGDLEIKYSTADNLRVNRTVLKKDVFMIKYESGTKEVFNEPQTAKPYQTAVQPDYGTDNRYDPDTSDFAKIKQKKFSGPRVGFTLLGDGTSATYLADRNKRQNFVQFGWQFETVLFTAGNTSGLIEFVPLIGGFEQGLFIPSLNVLLGIRGGEKHLFEFALGPNFSVGRDYAGNVQGTVGLVVAMGTSFRKDKINFPLSFAFVPSVGSKHDVMDPATGKNVSQNFETGWRFSILVGFNTRKH